MTIQMEELVEALFLDQVPASWSAKAYPSTYGLTSWIADLHLRIREIENWIGDFSVS